MRLQTWIAALTSLVLMLGGFLWIGTHLYAVRVWVQIMPSLTGFGIAGGSAALVLILLYYADWRAR